MYRLIPALVTVLLMTLTGCGSSPVSVEQSREVVLQYFGTDVGTAGPFFKGGKKELDILSAGDRQKAEALIDQGAAMFLIYPGRSAASAAAPARASHVVFVQKNAIVGDFNVPPPAAP